MDGSAHDDSICIHANDGEHARIGKAAGVIANLGCNPQQQVVFRFAPREVRASDGQKLFGRVETAQREAHDVPPFREAYVYFTDE